MRIGIDASRAFLPERTGIEEYSYQLIAHLADKLDGHQVFLYIRKDQRSKIKDQDDIRQEGIIAGQNNPELKEGFFILPKDWRIRTIKMPRFWTQIGLSLEMMRRPPDILLIPAHTVPCIHPKNTVVVIHGLEYEVMPEGYSFWERMYMRISIKKSCQWAKKIVAVSKNTKKDLVNLYKVPEDKIEVVHEGVNRCAVPAGRQESTNGCESANKKTANTKYKIPDTKYLLFVGRLEKRKNIEGVIDAFEILKEKYNIPHKLTLAGKPGFGYGQAKSKMLSSKYKDDIIETGFVSDQEKWVLMKNADVFLFPTFYEGFGLPILEAQSIGVPVLAANTSSIPEVAGDGAAYCDPAEPVSIADSIYQILDSQDFRDAIIKKGRENVKRFSWDICASEIAKLLNG